MPKRPAFLAPIFLVPTSLVPTSLVIATALALAGCSEEQGDGGNSAIRGSDTFLELVQDARVAMQAGKLPEAGKLYDEARALEPDNAGLWVDIARLRFRGGEHLTAIEAADLALELDPQYAPALLLRAQMVRDANGLAEALPWFEAAMAADPRNPEVMAGYAATLGDLGRYKDMLEVVRELAEFAPEYPEVHYLQAVLAARADDPVLASNLLSRSKLAEKGVPSALMLGAIVDLQQGSFDTAVETLEQLYKRQPDNVRVRELMARALWLGGRDREVIERFSDHARDKDASPYLVMLVGRSLERSGDRVAAIPFIERAEAKREGGWFVLDGSGSSRSQVPAVTTKLRDFVKAGNVSGAKGDVDSLLKQFPQSGDIHALAGDVALASGNADQALEMYEISARVRRSWPLTRKAVSAYRDYGDEIAADVLLTRYIAGDPHNVSALFLLSERSAEREDWLRVAVLLDTAIRLGAGNDLAVLEMRAKAARELKDPDLAKQLEARILQLKPAAFTRG